MATKDTANRATISRRMSNMINRPLEMNALSLDEAQELVHIGSWQWRVTSGNISWSDELYRIYGLKPQKQTIGFDDFIQLIHPDDREKVTNIINEAYRTKHSFEFEHRIVLPNKKIRILQGKGKVDTDSTGNVTRMFGTSQDITERKKSDLALHRSDERFKAVSAATNDLVYDIDLQTGTVWFNEVLNTEYMYPRRKSPYRIGWWMKHVHSDDRKRIETSIDALLRGQRRTWKDEYKFRKYDGAYIDVRDRAFVLRDAEQKPIRIIGSVLDVTRQKELERAKDRFISLVSHQLRTPLTSMRLLAEMLSSSDGNEMSAVQHEFVQQIEASTERMIRLVNEILSVSSIETGRFNIRLANTDINALIRVQIVELAPLTEEKCVNIIYTPDKSIDVVQTDPMLFSQIVHNLLTNAVRYTAKNGMPIHVSFQKTEKEYLLTVSDQGIGIPLEAQPYIFSSFYRANNAIKTEGDGSGLGLYLTKLILDMTGGKIWFKSETGKGSTFTVSIPLSGMRNKQSSYVLA